jgi:primosomal protein N' (replication factor Y)
MDAIRASRKASPEALVMTAPARHVPPRPDAEPPGALRYAQVAPGRPLDRLYSYLIPEALSASIQVGALVQAPLRSEMVAGVVVDIVDADAVPAGLRGKIKPLARRLSPDCLITPELIDLARWISEYYFCSLGETLAAVSMVGLNDVSPKMQALLALASPQGWLDDSADPILAPNGRSPTPGQRRVAQALLNLDNRPSLPAEIREAAGVGDGVLKTMLDRGWLERRLEAVDRSDAPDAGTPGGGPVEPSPGLPALTPPQQEAFDAIVTALRESSFQAFLLHGVTGSGKTEVYLRIIAEALRMGRAAILLVPEISLTPQVVDAFRRRFGALVGVYHSRLTLGQKLDLDRSIRELRTRVVIGARSALFVPLPSLGVIIVDEEHEASFKQGETPRYNARDVAVMRARRLGAVAVLGSATPSVESLHNAREGKYRRLVLPDRIGPHAAPRMIVVDMRRQAFRGSGASNAGGEKPNGPEAEAAAAAVLISPTLRDAIALRLERGEQTILLLNRRGWGNHVLCMACETQVLCPKCDVAMTYHKTPHRMLCHWCGHAAPLPEACPACGAPEIKVLGFGTQRIEEALERLFPQARSLRVDMDSMQRKGALAEAWRRISRREVDIILGTQMIAKGLHLEAVTLVGVISADFALQLPDFRSAERTYQLLTQVAGRAGRGDLPGEVILQTYMPHHYAIDCAARLAETEFYQRELRQRELLRFPPLARLAAVLVSGPNEEMTKDQAWTLAGVLKRLTFRPSGADVKILGPTPAPIARVEEQWRWRLLARSSKSGALHEALRQGMKEFAPLHKRGQVAVTIDIDPMDLL